MKTKETTIHGYTEDNSAAFAVSIHDLTGWPIVLVFTQVGNDNTLRRIQSPEDGRVIRAKGYPCNYMNQTPDGRFFDARGFSDRPLDFEGGVGVDSLIITGREAYDYFHNEAEAGEEEVEYMAQAKGDAERALHEFGAGASTL
jgi:hypothetical protein